MISMHDFSEIIKLRNAGKTQDEIAQKLGVNRRTIIRYLQEGKIPKYCRTRPTKIDPMRDHYETAKNLLEDNPDLTIEELYLHLAGNGYKGSVRTVRRKTCKLRVQLKRREVYFQRTKIPGEVMEGDFTKLFLEIGGIKREVKLWVSVLNYSNAIFATPFYYETFDCFCEGSINAFEEFKGIPRRYRLDNLSPAVSKILQGRDRVVTKRYAQFQDHYSFYQDFCNPSRGNEKGTVESNNKHFKRKLLNRINIKKIKFKDIDSLKYFIWEFCRELNNRVEVKEKFNEENLLPLPPERFDNYQLEVVSVNKYSLFSIGQARNMYSAPSEYVGLRLEARIYPERLDLFYQGEKVASHKRIYLNRGIASINIEHIIGALCKKPGALIEWKYREILFERPVWKNFYEKLKTSSKRDSDKTYLLCLNMIRQYNIENVTAAMELVLDHNLEANYKTLKQILENTEDKILKLQPININLKKYDNLIPFRRNLNDAS